MVRVTLAAAREGLAATLQALLPSVSVHAYPPEVVIPPAVVLVPDDPYMVPSSIGSSARLTVHLRLMAMVGTSDNESALANLEGLLELLYLNPPAGIQMGETARPGVVQVGPSDLLVAEIPAAITTNL